MEVTGTTGSVYPEYSYSNEIVNVDTGTTTTPQIMGFSAMGADVVSISPMSYTPTAAMGDPADTKFTASTFSTTLGWDTITYNNSSQAVTWDNVKLNLTGIAGASDSVIIQKDGYDGFNVFVNGNGTGYRLDANGKQTTEVTAGSLSNTASSIIINGSGNNDYTGNTGNNVIINRGTGVESAAGSKVFNYSSSTTITAGASQVYTVGLTGGSVSVTGGYVRVIGTMTGGTITMAGGDNTVDASTATISGGSINAADGATSANVTVKSLTGGIHTIEAASSTFTVKDGAKDATINFGKGTNLFDAGTKALTNVKITDTADAGVQTNIRAGSMTGGSIDLKGTAAADGNVVRISGAITGATIDTGKGIGAVLASSLKNTTILMDDPDDTPGTSAQTVRITGNVTDSTVKTGAGDDKIIIGGSVSGTSTFSMGAGDDNITISGNVLGNSTFLMDSAAGDDGNDVVKISGSVSGTSTITMFDGDNTLTIDKATKGMTYTSGAGDDNVTIRGAVSSSSFALGAGLNSFIARNTAGVYQALTDVSISSTGTTTDDKTSVFGGAYKATTAGVGINLNGAGENAITLNSIVGVKDTLSNIVMGAADGTSTEAQELIVNGAVSNINFKAGNGADVVDIRGAVSSSRFDLGGGTNSFDAVKGGVGQAMTDVSIFSSSVDPTDPKATDVTTVTGGAYKATKAGIEMDLGGGGLNKVELASVTGYKNTTGTLDTNFAIGNAASTEKQTLIVNGAVSNAKFATADGADVITITGTVTNATLDTGKGDDTTTISKAVKDFTYTGGDGRDDITINGTVTDSTFDLGDGASTFDVVATSGVGLAMTNTTITAGTGSAGTSAVAITGGAYTVNAKGTGTNITLGDGINTVNLASITGTSTNQAKIDLSASVTDGNTQKLTVAGAVKELDFTGGTGDGSINEIVVNGMLSNSTFSFAADTVNSISAYKTVGGKDQGQAINNVDITTAASGATTVKALSLNANTTTGVYTVSLGTGSIILGKDLT